jgi:F-type H+-transporting ATPase subunit delta
MVNIPIARRYARALLEASGDSTALELAEQLGTLVALIAGNPELADVAVNPAYSRSQRTGVLEALIRLLGPTSPTLTNFLRLLLDRRRLALLPDITRVFRDMADARAGRVRGTVVSAVALDPEAVSQLERTLSQILEKKVVLETRVDQTVIGGVSTQVGSVVFDGTLRSQLDDLKRALQG